MLGSLDNEVIFKKAFTDKIVFEHFVKDILEIDIKVGTIETEKKFTPPIGYVDFEIDVFAETIDKRVAVELQRAQYDYNFDRFMHYLHMLIAEQQKSSKKYKVNQTVYMIVVMTLPYKFDDLTGEAVREEVIVTKFSSTNLKGKSINIYAHQMVTLNPNHPESDTPQRVRDWLDLIYQSIHSPERPNINLNNAGIKRAADLIDYHKLTPKELADAKNQEQAQVVKSIYHHEERENIAIRAIKNGFDNATISVITTLSDEQIDRLRAKLLKNEK
jgi:PD-(D/E)XK nuclease family transposase